MLRLILSQAGVAAFYLLAGDGGLAGFDYHVDTDHPGGDMHHCNPHDCPAPGQPFALPKSASNMSDYAACHGICEAKPGCSGWVVLPSACNAAGRGIVPAGQAGCWLKSTFVGAGISRGCRVSGLVRAPAPPPPRPPLPLLPQPTELTVDAGNVTHQLRKLDMGCHSDSGYSHQPRNLYSQMIYGSSFESPYPVDAADGRGWRDTSVNGGSTLIDTNSKFSGEASQKLSGAGAAVANRGLGNEGLVFAAGKDYEGYLFAKSPTAAKLTLSICDWSVPGSPVTLTATILDVPAGNWSRLNFSARAAIAASETSELTWAAGGWHRPAVL